MLEVIKLMSNAFEQLLKNVESRYSIIESDVNAVELSVEYANEAGEAVKLEGASLVEVIDSATGVVNTNVDDIRDNLVSILAEQLNVSVAALGYTLRYQVAEGSGKTLPSMLVTSDNYDDQTLTVSWTNPSNVVTFAVYVDGSHVDTVSNVTEYTITGLEVGSKHTVYVVPVVGGTLITNSKSIELEPSDLFLRYINTGEVGSYHELTAPVTFAEGDEFTVSLETELTSSGGYLIADTNESFRIMYDEFGSITLSVTIDGKLEDHTKVGVLIPYMNGSIQNVKFYRTNGFLLVSVNNTVVISVYTLVGLTFNSIFKPWPLSRNFTKIDTHTKGYRLQNPIVLGADPFAIKARLMVVGAVNGRIYVAFGSSVFLRLDAYADQVQFTYNYDGPDSNLTDYENEFDGKFVELTMTYDGNDIVTGRINDTELTPHNRSTRLESTITGIFPDNHSGGSIIYPDEVSIWLGTNDTSQTPSHSWVFDDDGSSSIIPDLTSDNSLEVVGITEADVDTFTFDDLTNSWINIDESVVIGEV